MDGTAWRMLPIKDPHKVIIILFFSRKVYFVSAKNTIDILFIGYV